MKYYLSAILLMLALPSHAIWHSTTAKVKSISTYSGMETILVNLESDGIAVNECSNKATFAISKNISAEARARMYAMLLSAEATGKAISVAYADVGSCEPLGSTPNVYRTILRMN
ncbi:hypothetical protein [Thalassomonas actiniarum]|uniref:Uncharacterized protein n=1 Tax=Thalassomonas actiniarum TaxID=485447 RepID=A0AAE9YP34_9GAMM|nr:hypothetical protein [Thalassomonas actiniarum]WDD98161.1 hypothetical protein SG35_023235 [Thalassomonas actiniarum]